MTFKGNYVQDMIDMNIIPEYKISQGDNITTNGDVSSFVKFSKSASR